MNNSRALERTALELPAPGMGQSFLRLEDQALLSGQAQFLDDIPMDGVLHACFVRSPHAHARIRSIDLSAARALPGVDAVFAAQDLMGELTHWRMPLGFAFAVLPENTVPFVLARDEVAFVGEAIAVVVAQSRHIAEDAAALVAIDFEILPAVADARQALAPDAPPVRTELDSNVLQNYTLAYGEIDKAFEGAEILIEAAFSAHRGCAHPIEGRGVLARLDIADQELTVWSSTQMAHELHYTLALMLGQREDQLRVITPDVGGGFGAKFMIYPEEIVIPAVARLLRRPVKWIEDRRENFLTSIQERDQFWTMSLAADRDGRIRGLRGHFVHDHGAYTPQGTNVPYNAASSMTGPYLVPAFSLTADVVYTNKVPVATVRGAGYPQAAFVMDRLLDRLAQRTGLDPIRCRELNLIPISKIPYTKPLKSRAGVPLVIDSGDFPRMQAMAEQAMDRSGFEQRRQAALQQGLYLGQGLANAVKPTGRGPYESATVKIFPSGRIAVFTGALAMGQGIKTSLAQICAAHFGIDPGGVDIHAGDTRHIGFGMGGFASRQALMAGTAVEQASKQLREKVLQVAAAVLNAAPETLSIAYGIVASSATDQTVSLARLAMMLKGVPGYSLPIQTDPGLECTAHFHCDAQTYAGSTHACEVQVDAATGAIEITRYLAVQDCGNLINPLIVTGQVVGGVVHGLGNALFEHMAYDAQGQPLSTTCAEYLLPTAPEIPHIDVLFCPSPTPLNPLGVKGVGECSTIAVAAAVISAVEQALAPLNVCINEFPLSPMRLLELIDQATQKTQ
ncbi:xanthine dehydrogenase family protein molybdopterin-binding subunit [Alcaligenes sp. SDU_A2]|uniref:xanthine dehydrogenase family protein molybdopterin-binding subunit n=1 Tax=Alcaligenes sp. SDU_A2 TaxID=3136634 RepID=UPI00311E0620